ncbi:MAG: HAMP domain-containing histidine kinase [Acidobacteria bacterium]|nr:HAMP domain-containing histidine kinase [Acidobacteriota bacterium]
MATSITHPIPSAATRLSKPTMSPSAPPGEGTGLGLTICYGIVKRYQGKIWAQKSSLGGAEFVVELPTARSACPAADPPSTSSEKVEIGLTAGAVRVDWRRISNPRITHVENPSGR